MESFFYLGILITNQDSLRLECLAKSFRHFFRARLANPAKINEIAEQIEKGKGIAIRHGANLYDAPPHHSEL